MKRLRDAGFFIFTLFSASVQAGTLAFEEAMNEWSREFSACAAFYSTCRVCSADKLRGGNQENFEGLRKDATELSYFTGAGAGLSHATVVSRYESAMKSQMADIGNNCKGISVLLNKHGEVCKTLMEKPSQRLRTLMDHAR